jgi:hypothetical protein
MCNYALEAYSTGSAVLMQPVHQLIELRQHTSAPRVDKHSSVSP